MGLLPTGARITHKREVIVRKFFKDWQDEDFVITFCAIVCVAGAIGLIVDGAQRIQSAPVSPGSNAPHTVKFLDDGYTALLEVSNHVYICRGASIVHAQHCPCLNK